MLADLDAYLQRVGFDGRPRADLDTLRRLALAQPCAIAFENLDAFIGRGVNLAPAAVEHKLLHAGRGGWCFEQNLLLGNALRSMGFAVTDLAARVVWGRSADAVAARTHRILSVRAEGKDWLMDAGFGGQTLTGILDLHCKAAQHTPHELFRLRVLGNEQLLESRIEGEWRPLFRFDPTPQQLIDFEAVNYQLAHDPASHFVQGLSVSRVSKLGRHTLRGRELAYHPINGSSERRELPDADQVLTVLHDVFGIRTAGLPELPARLQTLFQ
jgi:N-hydroxyarylamine O-acetyltransferase